MWYNAGIKASPTVIRVAMNPEMSLEVVDRIEETLDVPDEVVEEIAARLERTGDEPTDERVRDVFYDVVRVEPELRRGSMPLAEAVRDELDDTE